MMRHLIKLICGLSLLTGSVFAYAIDSNIGETTEIKFKYTSNTDLAYPLKVKADALKTPVNIYEYVRNNTDFTLYHGARSGSINTFMGGRGNDVDQAAMLISMLRAEGYAARYAAGTATFSSAQVMNWLQVEDASLAASLLIDEGIQGVSSGSGTISMEHTWVEVLAPYTNYRGAGAEANIANYCTNNPSLCHWIALDPSFKQYQYQPSGIDPYNNVNFDYTAYYNALKNNDVTLRDKSPLVIYQEKVLNWLQTNSSTSGKTLQDIPDFGGIVAQQNGILPASLPFATTGTIRRYNSASDHDNHLAADGAAAYNEPQKWTKNVTVTLFINGAATSYVASTDLVTASTQRFTSTYTSDGTTGSQSFKLGGQALANGTLSFPVASGVSINGITANVGTQISLHLSMDASPNASPSIITASYDNLMIGGYYVIATGGETSNWSQVHRASQQLLAASQKYPVVLNPSEYGTLNGASCTASTTGCQVCDHLTGLNCTPYIDVNHSGYDSSDPKLLDNPAATDDLTGGLLYVAASQYYAKFRDSIYQFDRLNRIKTPIDGFLGVVSSTHKVEYVDGTAFSIQPGGLLIDMKGIASLGSWRIDQPANYSNSQFKLIGHQGSSLEHETWQELTGYDAISTMRGIQMSLAGNASTTLEHVVRSSTTDTTGSYYSKVGYSTSLPSGFAPTSYNLFGQTYQAWSNASATTQMVMFSPNTQGISNANDPNRAYYSYSAGLDQSYQSFANNITNIQAAITRAAAPASVTFTYTTQAGQDIIIANVVNNPGFYSSALTRTSATTYNLTINSVNVLADNTYSVPVHIQGSRSDNGLDISINTYPSKITQVSFNGPGASTQFTVTGLQNSGPNGGTATFTLHPNGAPDGHYSGFSAYFLLDGWNGQGPIAISAPFDIVNGRIIDLDNGASGIPVNFVVANNFPFTCTPNGITYPSNTPSVQMGNLQTCFNYYVSSNKLQTLNSFIAQNPTKEFRLTPANSNGDDLLTGEVVHIRDGLNTIDTTQQWAEFYAPTRLSVGSNFRFAVDIQNTYNNPSDAGTITHSTYAIQNEYGVAAGGGYVTAISPLNAYATTSPSLIGPSNNVWATPTFDNSYFTSFNTISQVNNNWFTTPSTADPVSTVTGNNYHDETDFMIKNRGMNYAFTRTYNSSPAATSVKGILGYGWTHSYGMKLVANDYGKCPNCMPTQDAVNGNSKTSSITYTDERGGDHNYLVNESSQAVTTPQGEFDSLALDTPSAGLHTLTFRNGTKYVFQTVGSGNLKTTPAVTARLIQIVDPWNNQLNLGYDASGRLSTVKDNLGITARTGLVFSYDASSNLSTIQDWSGRTWKYSVDTNGNLTSYTSAQALNTAGASTRTYAYASGHLLQTVGLPLTRNGQNVTTSFSYYENGRTFNNQDALGHGETLDYDLYRKTTRVTDPLGGIRSYEYDGSGRMTKLTEPDGGILFFQNTDCGGAANCDGLRYLKKDALGYPTSYSYNSQRTFNSTSDTGGNVTREQDALTQNVDSSYAIYDQIASVKDKRGIVINTSYHATTDATCKVTGKPDTVSIASLTVGGVVKTNVPFKSYCWNNDGSLKAQTEYLDATDATKTRITSYTYTDATHLNVQTLSVAGWDGVTTGISYTYDNLGRKKTETLNRRTSPTVAALIPLTTSYSYDNLDRVIQVQDAVGNMVLNRYDDNGQLWQVTHQYLKADTTYDVRNIVTRSFDAADRVLTETDALGGVTSYAYDEAGNVLRLTDANGHSTQYEYDAMNRRTAIIDGNNNRTQTVYNLRGEVSSITNPMHETTSITYDALGRKTAVTDPHGTTSFKYDANNNVTCSIDANANAGVQTKNTDGCTESRQYDELGRVTLIRDAMSGVNQIGYDLLGHALSQIDAEGRRYTWTYDGLGRLKSETDFMGNSKAYLTDEAGNIWQRTNRMNEVTQVTFDKLNRVTQNQYLKDSTVEQISYDPAGTIHSIANNNIAYTYGYDNLKRLSSKADSRASLGQNVKTLSFTYDKVSNILTKTTYQNEVTSYTYDSTNQLVRLSDPNYLSIDYQYDPAGRLLSRVMSSGTKSYYTYDVGGWLTNLKHYDAKGTIVTDTSYGRDKLGNITSMNNNTNSSASLVGALSYQLDPLYRLISANYPGTAYDEAYSYDHIGNRLTHTKGGLSIGATGSTTRYYHYTPASQTGTPTGISYTPSYNNRIASINIGSSTGTLYAGYSVDNEGRLTSQTTTNPKTLTWDGKGRLRTLTQNSLTERYYYDADDHRIRRSNGSIGTLDYYLEGDHLEAVYSGNTAQETYFRGSSIDELVAGYITQGSNPPTAYLFQHDQVMSVAAVTNPNGGVAESINFSPFGETNTVTGTQVSRLQFTGRENDDAGTSGSCLYQYRARYYDCVRGQFLSEDPKGFAAGINLTAYANNNPISSNDPSGLDAVTFGGSANILGVGGSAGVFITFPGKTKENFDVGGYASGSAPGFPWSYAIKEVNKNYPDVPGGVSFFKGTLDLGYEWGGRNTLGGTGTSFGVGAGSYGITVNPSGSGLSGFQVNLGPQLRFTGELTQTGTYSVGNFLQNNVFPAVDMTRNFFTAPAPQTNNISPFSTNSNSLNPVGLSFYDTSNKSPAGGYLPYPNTSYNNQLQSVYKK